MIGLGLRMGLSSSQGGGVTSFAPSFTDSFDEAVARYKAVYNMPFGTDVLETSTQTPLRSIDDLADYFNPLESGTGAAIINNEIQRYPTTFNATNTDFESDTVDITATLNSSHMPTTTANPTATVSYSRTILLSSTTGLKVGQVLGFGDEAYANLHTTKTYDAGTTITSGDTLTQTITDRDSSFSVLITATAGGSTTVADIVADMVAQINADSTLSGKNIKAYVLPGITRAYAITWPKRTSGSNDDFGFDANGSLEYITTTSGKTGSIAHDFRQKFYPCHIVSIDSGTQITVSHPVTLATSSVITFNPVYMMAVSSNSSGSTTVNVWGAPSSFVTVGQVGQFSYQDTNIRAVTASTSSSITFTNGVWMGAGHYVTMYPVYRAVLSSATTASTVLNFSSVPSGVQVGHVFNNYFSSSNSGKIKVVSKTATTVTLDTAVTTGASDTIVFLPEIDSGQFWSKFLFLPNADNRKVIAFEAVAKVPDTASYAAWPAFWLYPDSTDPSPVNPSGSSYELDFPDLFTYWNNASTGNYIGTGSGGTDIYLHPDWVNGSLTGNNTGIKERRFGVIWTGTKVFYYLDGILIRARDLSFDPKYRAQLGLNLAIGSIKTSFNSNGYFPVDASQFPMKYKLKTLKMWSNLDAKPLEVDPLDYGSGSPFLNLYAHFEAETISKTGSSVTRWDTVGDDTVYADQTNASRQPQSGTATVNGRNTVVFDGSNDQLQLHGAGLLTLCDNGVEGTILVACTPTTGGTWGNQKVIRLEDTYGNELVTLTINKTTGYLGGRWSNGYTYSADIAVNHKDDALHIVGIRRSGGDFQVYSDGTWTAAKTSQNGSVVDGYLGNSKPAWDAFIGSIHRTCIWDYALSNTDVEDFRQRMILEWS